MPGGTVARFSDRTSPSDGRCGVIAGSLPGIAIPFVDEEILVSGRSFIVARPRVAFNAVWYLLTPCYGVMHPSGSEAPEWIHAENATPIFRPSAGNPPAFSSGPVLRLLPASSVGVRPIGRTGRGRSEADPIRTWPAGGRPGREVRHRPVAGARAEHRSGRRPGSSPGLERTHSWAEWFRDVRAWPSLFDGPRSAVGLGGQTALRPRGSRLPVTAACPIDGPATEG